jgi:hypothetical protein
MTTARSWMASWRYEKLAANYLAMLTLAAALHWLRLS